MLILSRRSGLAASAAVLVALICTALPVFATDVEKTNTVMAVSEMCGGCVKKITARFDGVEGIAKIDCSIEKKSVTLVPKQGTQLSPKGIWEIMESIGKTPTKMVSPAGTFTSKPSA